MADLADLIARIPEEGWFTLGKHGQHWQAGLRVRANGAWMFRGGETAEAAMREVLSLNLPAPAAEDETLDKTDRKTCTICRVELNQPGKLETKDCGGDCLKCMASLGDPQCQRELDEEDLIG